MIRSRRRSPFVLILFAVAQCLAGIVPPASAQGPATGTPPFGSFGGGPDVINLADNNVHWTIPILHKPGRGQAFKYDLVYDSSVWYPVGNSWFPVLNWGWTGQTPAITGYATYFSEAEGCTINGRQIPFTGYVFNGYRDEFGVQHRVFATVFSGPGVSRCPGGPWPQTATGTAQDGSGYVLSASAVGGSLSAAVTSSNGTGGGVSLNAPSGAAATRTERNGNEVSLNGSGVFTDTLGTTALTVSGSGSVSSPLVFTYTPPNTSSAKCVSTNTSGVACFTANYTNFTVATNFGASGIGEYKSSAAVPLLTSIVLPDGNQFTFTYEPTPTTPSSGACTPYSGTTCTTARLASVTLPTGGTISYSYSGGNNGILPDGSAATLTRTTPDGVWTYAQVKGSGAASTTTVSAPKLPYDPASNQTVIQFQGIYETQRKFYQGSATSGTLLRTINSCYNGTTLPASTAACTGTAVTLPILQKASTFLVPGANNLISQRVYSYNSAGVLTEEDDYDYGSSVVGTLLKKTAISYASLGSITEFPQQITVTNGAGATVSKTTYSYDQTSVTATSGTPQLASVSGSRGNATTISDLTLGSSTLTTTAPFYDTGNRLSLTDVNNAQTIYTYGSCGNSVVTSTAKPLSLSTSATWNCTGGVQTQATDENGNNSTTSYTTDPNFWRPNSTTDQANATTTFTHNGETSAESVLSFNSGNSVADSLRTLDGLGRPHLQQTRQAPGSANFDTVETDYDALGRVTRVTLPYVGTAGQTNSSAPATTKSYDALGRFLSEVDGGGGIVTWSYSQNDIYITISPAPTGENTKRRQLEYDGLGRLTSVCEVTSATGSGTCGQSSAQTGFWTKYTYDALGNLASVTQNAQAASGNQQTRTYVHDGLSRLTSETVPESGTTTYTYDTDSTCGNSAGDLVKRVDNAGNTTCYSYDALHRVLSQTYSGPNASSTPNRYFVYDSATVNGVAMTNAKNHLAEAYTATSQTGTKITDVGFSYTARGETSDEYQASPNSGGYYHLSFVYWEGGETKQLSGLPGSPTFTYGADGEGRVNTVSASSGQNPVTQVTYNAAGLPTALSFGSSDSDSFSYDSNTNRMTQYQFNVNGQLLTSALTWNTNSTLKTQNITDALNSTDTQNCSYQYDDLTRVQSANCGTVWAQTFAYDPFGNISKTGNASFQPTYSSSTNQITSLPNNFTPSYDANGNVLNDSFNNYTWDANGRPYTIDAGLSNAVTLIYDALGRMIEQERSNSNNQIVYNPSGRKLAILSGQTLQKALIPLVGGAIAAYNSSGVVYYGHADHLGSVRLASTPARGTYFDVAYAPFGETYAQTGSVDPAYTGQQADIAQRQDTVAGLYDFLLREYSTQGRWVSPDPVGQSATCPKNPQTQNRYAYVTNNPLSYTDPLGTCGVYLSRDGRHDVRTCGGAGNGGGCASPTCDPIVDPSCPDPGTPGGLGDGGCPPCDSFTNPECPSCGDCGGGGGGFSGLGGEPPLPDIGSRWGCLNVNNKQQPFHGVCTYHCKRLGSSRYFSDQVELFVAMGKIMRECDWTSSTCPLSITISGPDVRLDPLLLGFKIEKCSADNVALLP